MANFNVLTEFYFVVKMESGKMQEILSHICFIAFTLKEPLRRSLNT